MMERNQIRMARIYAHELADALSAQITMHMRGVVADFPAGAVAIENANDALQNIAKSMGFTLTPLPSLEADVMEAAE